MTARAPIGEDNGIVGAGTAAAPAPPSDAYGGPSDPLLAPDYNAPSPDTARAVRAVLAPVLASVRTFAHAARQRAALDDTRAAYANGAADAALVVATVAADALAEARRMS